MNSINYRLDDLIKRALGGYRKRRYHTIATVDADRQTQGSSSPRRRVICGLPILIRLYGLIDDTVSIELIAREGEQVKRGR